MPYSTPQMMVSKHVFYIMLLSLSIVGKKEPCGALWLLKG